MTKRIKVVHLNFDKKDHSQLKERAESLGMPIATYAKAIVKNHLDQDTEDVLVDKNTDRRKSRSISNKR